MNVWDTVKEKVFWLYGVTRWFSNPCRLRNPCRLSIQFCKIGKNEKKRRNNNVYLHEKPPWNCFFSLLKTLEKKLSKKHFWNSCFLLAHSVHLKNLKQFYSHLLSCDWSLEPLTIKKETHLNTLLWMNEEYFTQTKKQTSIHEWVNEEMKRMQTLNLKQGKHPS